MVLKSITFVWALVVLFLSLYPFPIRENSTKFWEHTDKLVHGFMYFTLASLMIASLSKTQNNSKSMVWVYSLGVIYGIIIEVIQESMNMGRRFDFYDIVANSTGVSLALIGYFLLKKLRPQNSDSK